MKKLFEGNRGEIFLTTYRNKKAILKRLKPHKPNTLLVEKELLLFLEPYKIAPKLYDSGRDWLLMEYLQGPTLKEYRSKDALKEALLVAYKLDKLHVYHRQLGRFYHFIFTQNGVKVIDFERGKRSEKPRNVLQFVGYYLRGCRVEDAIALYKRDREKGIKALLECIDVC